ncbi:cupin domain-containing protein [Micromonospora sp. 067-2]|uniref:cupin domain-containing protein n=1 Tax=Micromonospora sp. 067-2 TaxID=2789270 RepID=UPI00397A7CE4
MSFPPRPDAGRAAAPATHGFVLGPDDGDPYHWLGTLSLTKLRGGSTTGNLDIVDHRVPPGYAPPKHVHSQSDEVFYLLDGHLDVTCGDDTWQANPGSLVFLPRGVPHGFTNRHDDPARTLLINSPAGFGELIVALGDPAPKLDMPAKDAPMPPPDRVAKESDKYGIGPATD